MTKLRQLIEVFKVLVTIGLIVAALAAPVTFTWWLSYHVYQEIGHQYLIFLMAVAGTVPAVLVGILLSRASALLMIYLWGRES